MDDMTSVIIPKSDQLNADSLLAGPMTVTIKEVVIHGGQEQPVSIALHETPLFFRPCKSMSRVLVAAWGADAKAYVGRSLTLYRDPTVKWGGLEVGGIRISHMSNIDGAKMLMLTATKGSRKPHKVLPLATQTEVDPAEKWAAAYGAKLATLTDLAAVEAFGDQKAAKLAELQGARPDLHKNVTAALEARKAQLAPAAPATSGFTDDDEVSFGTPPAPAQPETLLEALDNGGAQQSGDDQAAGRANSIIDEIKAANAIIDLNSIEARHKAEIAAMSDDLADAIEAVIVARKFEIQAERDKARTAEAAE